MSDTTFSPGPTPNTVRAADGKVLTVPAGWVLLPPGDAALTRRVKAAGDHWVVQEKKGRKVFSKGVWAPEKTIERIQADLEAERSTESFAKKKEADAKRREKAQEVYVEDFTGAVRLASGALGVGSSPGEGSWPPSMWIMTAFTKQAEKPA